MIYDAGSYSTTVAAAHHRDLARLASPRRTGNPLTGRVRRAVHARAAARAARRG